MPPRCLPTDGAWLETARETIARGGVVALPFERLFGLAADALVRDAVARVAAIKTRPERAAGASPIAVILPQFEAIERVARELSPLCRSLAQRYWPGLVTLLVRARPDLPAPLVSRAGLIGVRLPGPCAAAELARFSGCVLTATSANQAGAQDATSHSELQGLQDIDLVVEGKVDGPPGSTIVDVSGAYPVIVRQGAVRVEEAMP